MSLRFTLATFMTIQAAVAANSLNTLIDSSAAAIEAGNYRNASLIVGQARKTVESKLGQSLSRQRASEALHAQIAAPDTLKHLNAVKDEYARGDYEQALFDLSLADKGIAVMFASLTPQQRTDMDAAEATKKDIPYAWHVAAVSALKSGDTDRALQFSFREIDKIPGFYPGDLRFVELERAWTLNGVILLAKKDVPSAKTALARSVEVTPTVIPGDLVPEMALAQMLLAAGERSAVTSFLERCAKLSSNPKLLDWKRAVDAGQLPDFGLAGRVR